MLETEASVNTTGSVAGQIKKSKFTTFESRLNYAIRSADKSGDVHMKVLELLLRPDMAEFPDYPATAIRANHTEAKTLSYELKRCMNPQAMIQTLETASHSSDHVKNENLELVARLPFVCKVSVKERIAPLRLKFEFFDSLTQEKVANPDVVVCISPTTQWPTDSNCLI